MGQIITGGPGIMVSLDWDEATDLAACLEVFIEQGLNPHPVEKLHTGLRFAIEHKHQLGFDLGET